MSELSFESQESKTAPSCHDRPPQYDSCHPSQDVLTSVIENEHTRRMLLQRVDELNTEVLDFTDNKEPTDETDYHMVAEYALGMARLCGELVQVSTELANIYKERTVRNTELYIAMSRLTVCELTVCEFNRTYASSRQGSNRQVRHEPAQDHDSRADCYNRDCGDNCQRSLRTKQIEGDRHCTCDSPCSCDRFFELKAKVEEINDKLGQSLQSHDTANVSKMTHDARAKPSKSFWKRILKH
ncbi:hypothetical protein PITC_057260 [Penicillium italicum]|uniref:Uncharacterized protein n=1 Tax=Penicillium italicum TaxID=40296 RepID=A0A0A2L816_PENIT|nr:hypothetical protein PITC_057260 [Penicillium italicum]